MNFQKDLIPPPFKKPSFTGYGNDYMVQERKRSVSLLTLCIVIVSTFVVAFLLFKNFDRISNLFTSPVVSTTGFTIGQTVSLSGALQADGDLISYTHTLTMIDATIVGLKSRTLDIGLYSGVIHIQGIVEKEFNNISIIEVNFISGMLLDTGTSAFGLLSGNGNYIPSAAIYLPGTFSEKYSLLNQGENGVLKIKNIDTNQIVLVSYFACKVSDPNKNCVQLQKNISATAEKTVSSIRGDTLYKLEGVTSWFFTNGDLYGYFINDVPENEVISLVNTFVLPNAYYVKNTLLSKLQVLCTDGSTSLMQVTTYSLGVDLNGLILNLAGPTDDGTATCKVFIDPSLAEGGSKLSYISNTSVIASDTGVNSGAPLVPIDTSVEQFPINLEKTMTFTSSKGYTIIFPSKNIAYSTVNVDDTLDLPGVRCFAQMNVVKFSDKDLLSTDPKLKIFTCTIKGTLNNLGNSIIQKTALTGTNFLIQIMDSAWAQFANNIQIN